MVATPGSPGVTAVATQRREPAPSGNAVPHADHQCNCGGLECRGRNAPQPGARGRRADGGSPKIVKPDKTDAVAVGTTGHAARTDPIPRQGNEFVAADVGDTRQLNSSTVVITHCPSDENRGSRPARRCGSAASFVHSSVSVPLTVAIRLCGPNTGETPG